MHTRVLDQSASLTSWDNSVYITDTWFVDVYYILAEDDQVYTVQILFYIDTIDIMERKKQGVKAIYEEGAGCKVRQTLKYFKLIQINYDYDTIQC